MEINWHKSRDNELFVTINKNNFIMNKECDSIMGSFKQCILGYSKKRRVIIIKPVNEDSYEVSNIDGKLYRMSSTVSYLRVSCTDFITSLIKDGDLKLINGKRKFIAKWDNVEKWMTIEIK